MIIADASLLANYLNPLVQATEADSVYGKDAAWHSPSLWRYELRNTLVKYLRKGTLTLSQSNAIMEDATGIVVTNAQGASDAQVFDAAMRYKITAYDAEYVALAQKLGVPLITFDQKLVRAAPGIALSPADFLR